MRERERIPLQLRYAYISRAIDALYETKNNKLIFPSPDVVCRSSLLCIYTLMRFESITKLEYAFSNKRLGYIAYNTEKNYACLYLDFNCRRQRESFKAISVDYYR